MSVSTKCPGSAELRDLLDSGATDSGLVAHLDQCSSCQQALEDLADSDGLLCKSLQDCQALSAPAANSAYWPAVKEMTELPTSIDVHTPRPFSEISLKFLTPSEDGDYLGSLGHFNVVRVVGRGGMGVVLHAVDTCLERDVALKILEPELAKDEMARTRFCREARAAASITHENVVGVYQVVHEEESDLPFLVMELISGESLERKLQRDGRLPLKDVVRIGMQTAAGLAAAHEKGLIHRDIKPGNILLEQSGQRVKLTDFGLARAAEDVRLTSTGMVAGTPLYMSPEQASGGELDARSDLFSLGVVLYELAAGEPPFNGKTPLAVLKKLTDEKHQPLRERNPQLPEWFAMIVDRLLAKKPEERFQSARELADTLEHFWAMLKTSSDTMPICPKKRAFHLWRTVGVGVAAGLGTLLIGLAAFLLFVPRHDRTDDAILAPLHTYKGNSGPLWSMAISKDGKKLAMGTDDGYLKFWDIATEQLEWSHPAHTSTIWALALSGELLATGSDDGPAKIWDIRNRKDPHPLGDSLGIRALAFDAEGKRVLTGGRNGKVKLFDAATGTKIFETAGHTGLVGAVAFSPDGKLLASASGDKSIKIWDAATGQEKLTLKNHEAGVYAIAFAPNGRMLVSGAWDKTVRLWDLDSGSPIDSLPGPTQDVWSVDFSPNGKLVAATGEDQMVRVWDVASQKEVTAFRGSMATVLNVRFLPEPGFILAGGKDGNARLWSIPALHSGW
jgi:eukaryotic-like serine/threonine-protein kinase